MSFDAGKIIATADLDRGPFNRSVTQLRAEGRRLAGEKFTAKLGADTREGDAQILAFRRRVDDATRPVNTKLTVDNARALLALEPVAARLDDMRNRITTAKVTANTQSAKDKLDDLDLTLKRIGQITSRPRVSVQGVETAKLQLDRLELQLDRLDRRTAGIGGGGSGGGFLSGARSSGFFNPSGKALAIAGAVPLAAPVAGLAAGAASSLLTPLVAGGSGGAAFGAAAKSTYTTVATQLKTLQTLQARYNAATSDKTRLAALTAEKRAWSQLSPAEQKAVNELHTLHNDWTKFQNDLHPQTFKLLATGLNLAHKGLKLLEPDALAAGKAINTLATRADKALNDPYWKHFFGTFLPGQTHSALLTLGTDLGNVGSGLAHLTEKFAPLGQSLERDSVKWTQQFNRWTQGDGPGKFVAWVQKNGPTAAHDLKDVASGIGHILQSLAPLGQLELAALGPILKFVGTMAKEHPKEIEALGAAYLVVAGGLKAISAVSGIAGTAKAVTALFTALRSGKGLAGVKDVLKGGPGMAGCCCGPGGGGGTAGTAGKDAKTAGEGEVAVEGGRVARIGATAGRVVTRLAGDTLVTAPIIRAILPGGVPDPLLKRQGFRGGNTGEAARLFARIGGSSFPQDQASITAVVKEIQKLGSPQQIAQLQKLALTNQEVANALSNTKTEQDLVSNALNNYRGQLEQAGVPISKINGLVATYAHTLKGVPPQVITKVLADTSQAERKFQRLLAMRAQLAQAVTAHVITAVQGKNAAQMLHSAGGPIYGPGTATSDSILARLSNGEFVMRASAVRHYGVGTLAAMNRYAGGGPVIFNPGGQHASPNAPGSSSSGSSRRGPSSTAAANVLAGIMSFAGLTFLSDLKSTENAIRSGILQMIDRLNNAVRQKYLASDAQVVKELTRTRSTLVALAGQELIVGKALSAAQTTLSNLRSQAASTRSGALSTYQGLGDLSLLPNVNSVAGILTVEGQQGKLARAFTRNLSLLRKEGLNKTEYEQLLAAGPGAVGNQVALLAHASPRQIRQLNRDTRLLTGMGTSVGAASASYLYGAQIHRAQHQVQADRQLLHALTHDQSRVADLLAKYTVASLKHSGNVEKLLRELIAATYQSHHAIGKSTAAALNGTAHHAKTKQRVTPRTSARF